MTKFDLKHVMSLGPCISWEGHVDKDWSGDILSVLRNDSVKWFIRLWIILHCGYVSQKFIDEYADWLISEIKPEEKIDPVSKENETQDKANCLMAAQKDYSHLKMNRGYAVAMFATRSIPYEKQKAKLEEMIIAGEKSGDVF